MRVLKGLLFIGAIYFWAVALAHIAGIKYPGLYIYFFQESLGYQDHLIAILAFGWGAFFRSTASTLSHQGVLAILVSSALGLFLLAEMNYSNSLLQVTSALTMAWYHLETAVFGFYWVLLVVAYFRVSDQLER